MRRALLVTFSAFAASFAATSSGFADELDDCRRPARPEQRLAACGSVIAGSQFSAEQKAAAFRFRGDTRVQAGALDDAIADYTNALTIDPSLSSALAGRGQAHFYKGAADRAIADYSAAIERLPKSANLWVERGHVKLAIGDTDGAIADLTQAVELNPRSAHAYNNRGLAYRKKGDFERAYQDYTAAVLANPIYALGYANRGYLEEARGRKAEAIADLRAAIMLDPSMSGVGEALKRLGATDPFADESRQRVLQGKALVEARCATCHAVGADGVSAKAGAPEFRTLHQRHAMMALREPLTRGIAAPHDEMPKFTLSAGEIDAIVAYINSLGPARQ